LTHGATKHKVPPGIRVNSGFCASVPGCALASVELICYRELGDFSDFPQ
jgi:hypothetical protein